MEGLGEDLKAWIGRRERRCDRIAPWPLVALAAALDRSDPPPDEGDPVPPGGHWLYFLEAAPASDLGADGHPRRGGFLPPVPLPRRMWAGGRLTIHQPLRVGAVVERVSEVVDVRHKRGRSGDLVFVVVRHSFAGPGGPALVEEHDIVYRGDSAGAAPELAPAGAAWTRVVTPDPVLLFRYSALTFNGHRIHYDQPYATGVEGYPGLVVHGPLLATLLLDLVRRQAPAATVRHFAFRALAPVFDTAPFTLNGQPAPDGGVVDLWVTGPGGILAMHAEARL